MKKLGASISALTILLASCVQASSHQRTRLCVDPGATDQGGLLADRYRDAGSGVMVVAHRACWRETAENSLSAIAACINMGVDMVELDVRQTSDGHLVVMHDETVDRMTSGRGMVNDMSLSEIRLLTLKAHDGAGAAMINEHVPTLAQALEVAKGRILINIDAKDDIRSAALDLAESKGMLDQIIIKAPAQSAEQLLEASPDYLDRANFMPIVGQRDAPLSAIIASYETIAPEAIEVIYSDPSFVAEGVQQAHRSDTRIWINTLSNWLAPGHWDDLAIEDPDAHWGALIGAGATMFQTDRPAELLSYLRQSGRHCQ